MDSCHTQTCLTTGDLGRQHGITVTSVKDLSSKPVTIFLVGLKYTIVMEENVTQDFSLITDLSINQTMRMKFQL